MNDLIVNRLTARIFDGFIDEFIDSNADIITAGGIRLGISTTEDVVSILGEPAYISIFTERKETHYGYRTRISGNTLNFELDFLDNVLVRISLHAW